MLPGGLRSSPGAWCLLAGILLAAPAAAQSTTRVSVNTAGVEANAGSAGPSLSAGARFVAFASLADNLVRNDVNGEYDVFVHDRQTGRTICASLDRFGKPSNGRSVGPSISADGRFLAFQSDATNLVSGDTNREQDVFVRDLKTGQTRRVSVGHVGAQANGHSSHPRLSADGRIVTFWSDASNLVPGDTGSHSDTFVHERQTGQTSRISVDPAGQEGNGDSTPDFHGISADGRYVAFSSGANNLIPGDRNDQSDIFVRDRVTGQTSCASVSSDGLQGYGGSFSPAMSADGRYVAFQSGAKILVPGDTNGTDDVFVHDRWTGHTRRVSVGSTGVEAYTSCTSPAISADGRYVSFSSKSSNLVYGDTNRVTDIFVHDRFTRKLRRVSVDSSDIQGNDNCGESAISADGYIVAFFSYATNLVPGDTNQARDVFLHENGLVRPSLRRAGGCPGRVTLTIGDATPGGKVLLACGQAGNYVRRSTPCDGLILGITPPALGTILIADGSGTAILSLMASFNLCGLSAQAVDVASCQATNVIVL